MIKRCAVLWVLLGLLGRVVLPMEHFHGGQSFDQQIAHHAQPHVHWGGHAHSHGHHSHGHHSHGHHSHGHHSHGHHSDGHHRTGTNLRDHHSIEAHEPESEAADFARCVARSIDDHDLDVAWLAGPSIVFGSTKIQSLDQTFDLMIGLGVSADRAVRETPRFQPISPNVRIWSRKIYLALRSLRI